MITFEEAKKKVAPENSPLVINKSGKLDDLYIFTLRSQRSKNVKLDPVSVNSKTGAVLTFNPITVGSDIFERGMKILK